MTGVTPAQQVLFDNVDTPEPRLSDDAVTLGTAKAFRPGFV
ncbi:hypothetical protein SAMN05216553_10913 [Lentzea fradiae]|uniref:Uncharacterized protein n=1 Tax=Lentzea fradiae TaxID=200378 RepID=A0A1G7V507_9PSEU|nr:hypothetical protein [Lentzea fradiae]SDG54892.1 hypothetical protein SAMN05216553_10913 [Lentzea fradiae]